MHHDHTETDKNSPGENRDYKRDDGLHPTFQSVYSRGPWYDQDRQNWRTERTEQ